MSTDTDQRSAAPGIMPASGTAPLPADGDAADATTPLAAPATAAMDDPDTIVVRQAAPEAMAAATPFPRQLILPTAALTGVLIGLAMYLAGRSFGLDLDAFLAPGAVPVRAAYAWWLIAAAAFAGGYITEGILIGAEEGKFPAPIKYGLGLILVATLAAAGQLAAAPGTGPSATAVLAGLAALLLGSAMAFSGAYFAMRRP